MILLCLVVGVNLLIGTDSGMMLLDRSGQGKGSAHWLLAVVTVVTSL